MSQAAVYNRFKYRLSSLLIAIAVAGVIVGAIANYKRSVDQREQVVAALEANGFLVAYDFEVDDRFERAPATRMRPAWALSLFDRYRPCDVLRIDSKPYAASTARADAMPLLFGLTEVRVLSLASTDLRFVDLSSVNNLTRLQRLDLADCQLVGDTLSSLSKAPAIEDLCLRNVTVTADFLKPLKSVSTIRRLDLTTGVSGRDQRAASIDCETFKTICGIRSLTELTLTGRQFDSGISECLIEASSQLRSLDLSETNIDDTSVILITRFENLRSLDLSYTTITGRGIETLLLALDLHSLSLASSGISDEATDAISRFEHLRKLDIQHNHISDVGVERLSQLSELEVLDLEGVGLVNKEGAEIILTNKSAAYLSRMQSLRRLNLDHSAIDDAGAIELAKIPGLRLLSLIGTRITSKGEAYLQQRLPSTEIRFK